MQPDKRLYEAMITYYSRRGELEQALSVLGDMKKQNLLPEKDRFSALVTAHALAGKLQSM